jgi:Tfp pilus assembly protein PilF
MRGASLAGFALLLSCAGAAAAQEDRAAEAHFNAGLSHLREGRPALAVGEFKEAIKRDKKNPYFHKGLGVTYLRLNRPKDAVKAFREALEINPYYVDVRNDLGTALILLGKREEGKQEFIAAFNDATNPTPEITAANLGRAHLEERKYAQALNWYRTAISRNQEYAEAHLGLAESLRALSRPDEAIAQLELGLEATPDHPALLLALGEALYEAGRFQEARDKLEQAVAKDPAGASGMRASELLKRFPQ